MHEGFVVNMIYWKMSKIVLFDGFGNRKCRLGASRCEYAQRDNSQKGDGTLSTVD